MTLKDFKPNELHLYMKFRSFMGKIGEIVKLEKYALEVDSSRCSNLLITIRWDNGELDEIEYEMNCEIEYID
jgi:hypothetical protein